MIRDEELNSYGRSGARESLWSATSAMPEVPRLRSDLQTQVCVVGAGIAGMTTAYLLAREGARVVVVDAGQPGSGMSGRTTAHLSNAIDDRYTNMEKFHGPRGARLAAESHTAAIDMIEEIVVQEGISCSFERVNGYLLGSADETTITLQEELEAAEEAGLIGVELVAPPLSAFPFPALRFSRQGQFHPLRYLDGLVRAFQRMGGQVYSGAHVQEVRGGSPGSVHAGGFRIAADAIVVATNSPINDRVVVHTKQAPYMTYVIALPVDAGAVEKALYWDTLDPYHYVRLQEANGAHLLIVGGEDYETGQEKEGGARFESLEVWARTHFPVIGDPAYRWSGQVMETVDGLGFIGRSPVGEGGTYVITGDSGMGMTHGTIGGMLVRDLILGRENPWSSLYDPWRVSLATAKEFARENLNVAMQYTRVATPGELRDVSLIASGAGAVIRRGISKIAAYRDLDGNLHELSAVCSHLGCIVSWNDTEKTWDCPCHGSRYSPLGEVISGPAATGLHPADEKSP